MSEKKRIIELPQTKGSFQVRGVVTGTKKEKFYTEKLTSTGKPWRSVNFGVTFKPSESIYVGLNGMERNEVYFSKKSEVKGEKSTTEKVAWSERFSYTKRPDKKDFKLIGVSVGVTKIKDEKGNDVNDKKTLTEFDACDEISKNLVDGQTVFVRGNIEFSQYKEKCSTKFVPTQVSLGKDIEFEADNFKPVADFTQTIVFIGVRQNEDKTKFMVDAKIINYESIEDAEFVITDKDLANMFRKNLKPYTSLKVWGDISIEEQVEEVTTTDCWGKKNEMDKQNTPTTRELVITGADPETIDTKTYSEKEIDKAIEAIKALKNAENDFGNKNNSWGTSGSNSASNENDGWD